MPVFASALSFVLYGAIGHQLRSEVIFPALAYFTVLRTPLMVLPSAYTATIDAYVAMKRIEAFLLSEETDSIGAPDPKHEYALSMENAGFLWEALPNSSSDTLVVPNGAEIETTNGDKESVKDSDTASHHSNSDNSHDDHLLPYLEKINLRLARGSLVAIVGPVGSGKSSLLQAMIGNMTMCQGKVTRGTNISYASQTAWIQNASIRDNILFDTPFEEARYWRVVKACSLEQDLKLFPFGDQTEIGERGVNLSGGQKARLSLARSVYFRSGLVIMDDPLSAVDAHVGKRLWEDCLMTELAGRTRVIATHQLHVLPDVDYVICMKNGKIAEEGTFKDLIDKSGDFCALMAQYGGVQSEKEEEVDITFDDIRPDPVSGTSSSKRELNEKTYEKNNDKFKDGVEGEHRKSVEMAETKPQKLMTEEERESGAVKGNVYGGYLRSSGWHLWFLTFGLFIAQQVANVM